jgi:hypothetical protein
MRGPSLRAPWFFFFLLELVWQPTRLDIMVKRVLVGYGIDVDAVSGWYDWISPFNQDMKLKMSKDQYRRRPHTRPHRYIAWHLWRHSGN